MSEFRHDYAPPERADEPHVDEMTALLFVEQRLNDEQEKKVNEHARTCAKCRALLHVIRNEDVWLRQALSDDEEPLPALMPQKTASAPALWGWGATLGLATAGAYTLWSGIVEPWMDQASQAGFTQGNLMTMLFFSGAFWNGWSNVLGGFQLLGLATLAAMGIWLLRGRFRRPRRIGIAMVMGVLACTATMPSAASAADIERGRENYTLAAGQEVKSDLIVWADHIQIDGDVDGDLIAGAHEVEVNGHIKGDIIAFTENLRVNGVVDGNVRTGAQEAVLTGLVAKNLMVFAGRLDLTNKGKVGGSATVVSQNAQLRGAVTRDVLAAGESLEIDGSVGGNVMIRGQNLNIGSSAEIGGKTQFTGPNQPQVAVGAKLASPIDVTIRNVPRRNNAGHFLLSRTLRWGAAFVLGMLLFLLAPAFFADVTDTTKKVGLSMGVGVICLIVTPIAALIACVTIVGLAVGISTLLTYAVAVYTAQVFVGQWVGERILGTEAGQGPMLLRLAVGLAILHAIHLVPFIGWVAMLVVTVWGLGASTLTIYRRMRQQTVVA